MTELSFSWKPALAVGRTTAIVDPRSVVRKRGGNVRRVAFADVSAVRLVEIAGRQSACSLVLVARHGKLILHCGVRLEDARHDSNARAYAAACAAVLDALGRARPDLQVSQGGGPALRGFTALMGAVLAVVGVCFGVLALAEGGVGERVFNVLVGGVLAWTGAAMAMSFNPFRPVPRMPAAELARNLAVLAAD